MTDTVVAPPLTAVDASPAGQIGGFDRSALSALADNFMHVTRTAARLRARWLAAAQHDVEWSAHLLLKVLEAEGSMRAGAVAEALQADPSTVSRQAAALVRDGLLERGSDPDDGRASLLILTPKAREILADHEEMRLQHFAEMLGDWPPGDVSDLAALLGRFAAAYDDIAPRQLDARITARSTNR